MLKIYIDLDGVLADFNRYMESNNLGKFRSKKWPLLPKDFFLLLHPMEDAHELWNFVKQYDAYILTAVPRPAREMPDAAYHKKVWANIHFGIPEERILTVQRHEKKDYATPTSILIDDHKGNIIEWGDHGGHGILHGQADESIASLKLHIEEFGE